MKIGIIGHLKFPIARPHSGGLESFTQAFVEALCRRGHDVDLFAAGDSDPSLPLVPITEHATVPESQRRLGAVDHHWIEDVEDDAYSRLMIRLSESDYDVIHNHSLSPLPLRFAGILPSRLLTTVHVPVLPRLASELRSRRAERCGDFVNISRTNAASWRPLIPSQTIIHNGVDTQFWQACGRSGERPAGSERAVWFGRILAEKGTHLAIEAAHRAGLPIDVVGPICDADYFEHRVRPLLRTGDHYHGHQRHERLRDLIRGASVALVTPCWDEPFGLVVAEAAACGTPVAGFARGALPEIVDAAVGRLAAPNDVPGLARAITACLQLDRDSCCRTIQRRFGFDRMVADYERLYQQLPVRVAA
ncbi:glycosyltransferase family 4 protein [Roseimaritima sediminicola]|uniref:glycosyltransferase family 4 protein n=1 Tax=Roseimaritima sediminicola TaxID=2662066 RepID=UPI0012983944|nr:glycosyltransferase family 4 protein [Roseimaritima sediminicola]